MKYAMPARERAAPKHRRRRCSFGCTSSFEGEWGYLRHLEQHHGLTEQRWRAEIAGTVQAQFTDRGRREVVA